MSESLTRELVDALTGVMDLVNNGTLVRNTAGDAAPDWAIKQLPMILALKAAETAIAKARGKA